MGSPCMRADLHRISIGERGHPIHSFVGRDIIRRTMATAPLRILAVSRLDGEPDENDTVPCWNPFIDMYEPVFLRSFIKAVTDRMPLDMKFFAEQYLLDTFEIMMRDMGSFGSVPGGDRLFHMLFQANASDFKGLRSEFMFRVDHKSVLTDTRSALAKTLQFMKHVPSGNNPTLSLFSSLGITEMRQEAKAAVTCHDDLEGLIPALVGTLCGLALDGALKQAAPVVMVLRFLGDDLLDVYGLSDVIFSDEDLGLRCLIEETDIPAIARKLGV